MQNVVGVILGGGKGTRLFPLTEQRSKPAVPLGAKYRLIDIPISNCLNSHINRIYVLTQFNSVSLHRHIRQAYKFDRFHGGFVEILAAQQTVTVTDWYQGTADAVRKNLRYLEQPGIDYVAILSGDQLYRMDFEEMLAVHQKANADVTISAVPLSSDEASDFGIMQVDDSGRVTGFVEKPQTEEELSKVRTDPAWIDALGIESRGRDCLASMGIYLFNRDVLVDLLKSTDYEDFGKEVFPMCIETKRVQLYLFDGYWEDIGTIRSFYESNLALVDKNPPFEFSDPKAPIYTRPRFLPPSRMGDASIKKSLIADGCFIEDDVIIENSIIGLRCKIGKGTIIRDSVLMGNDYYDESSDGNEVPLGIGENCKIETAIVDKNCRIKSGTHISPEMQFPPNTPDRSAPVVQDGIIVIPKGYSI